MDDGRTLSLEEQNLADLAAAFGNHQITDDEGQLAEPTADQEEATDETNTFEETATPEKAVTEDEISQDEPSDDNELAVDEKGKRYIPEKRLKKETAKRREAERKAAELEAKLQQQPVGLQQPTIQTPVFSNPTEDVETEVLFSKYPQFDPESDEYSKGLDKLGLEIYRANPGISRIKAAKLAIERAKELTSDSAKIVAEARAVKSQQSDQGITSRVVSRGATQIDPSNMSLEEKEAYLKANGMWD